MPQRLYLWEGALVPIVEEARWSSEPVWTGEEERKSLISIGV
jgi:hypothetical protein